MDTTPDLGYKPCQDLGLHFNSVAEASAVIANVLFEHASSQPPGSTIKINIEVPGARALSEITCGNVTLDFCKEWATGQTAVLATAAGQPQAEPAVEAPPVAAETEAEEHS
jgi:hypothetical protein